MTRHPAKFTDALLPVMQEMLAGRNVKTVLDPFAGTGKVHLLGFDSWGVELEPEWAGLHPRTIVGDALKLPFADASFDAVVTSPAYGNRMADHHNARDSSRRNTYKHALGRDLTPGNSGKLQWGSTYRAFHQRAWIETHRVIRPGGYFLLNIKDHYRGKQRQRVSAWHVRALVATGFQLVQWRYVRTPGNRFGANRELRVEGERLYLLERP